ncbi:MAG: hypothetical protein ACJ74O_00590 [Frankiaceae bacterium]
MASHARHSRRRSHRWLAVGAGALASLALAGTATARWASSGTGAGGASSAAGLAALTTTATVATGAALVPGGTAAALSLKVANPGSIAVTVTAIALDSSRSIVVSGAKGTCTSPPLTVTTPVGWAGLVVPAGGTTGATTIAGAVSLGAGASSGCQGATFTIPVTLAGHS